MSSENGGDRMKGGDDSSFCSAREEEMNRERCMSTQLRWAGWQEKTHRSTCVHTQTRITSCRSRFHETKNKKYCK